MAGVSSKEWSADRGGSYRPTTNFRESKIAGGDDVEVDEGGGAFSSADFSCVRASSSKYLMRTFNLPIIGKKDEDKVAWDDEALKRSSDFPETVAMKERFAKLLLGEDVTGGTKGVSTALAISNAITNLSVFGAHWKLEPLPPQKKAMWFKEMEWLLSVSDLVVEFVPTVQQSPNGSTYEVMATRQRSDLYTNLPALKKLDAMLISILDEFEDKEFWYEDHRLNLDDNWLAWPIVPGKGLSEDYRNTLQQCRDNGNQILKAALAIRTNVLAEMDVPDSYLENLPKNGKDWLGDTVYNYLTDDYFEPNHILSHLDLSSENQVLDMANNIEGAVLMWKQKEKKKQLETLKSKRKAWGGKVKSPAKGEKNQYLAERVETLLQYLKLQFPGLPQTALDMNKIKNNKDVGHAILESYSSVMESVAFNLIARINDVLYVDDAAKCNTATGPILISNGLPIHKKILPSPFPIHPSPYSSLFDTPHPVARRMSISMIDESGLKTPYFHD